MRTSTKVIGALAIAGALAAGGSAFTASNDFTGVSTNVAGYGESTETGATVTNIAYANDSSDASKLATVTFTTSTNITGLTATMVLKKGSTVVEGNDTCTLGTWNTTSSTMTVTCTSSGNAAYTSFDTTGLTVTQ